MPEQIRKWWVIEWLWLNTKLAVFQLYCGEPRRNRNFYIYMYTMPLYCWNSAHLDLTFHLGLFYYIVILCFSLRRFMELLHHNLPLALFQYIIFLLKSDFMMKKCILNLSTQKIKCILNLSTKKINRMRRMSSTYWSERQPLDHRLFCDLNMELSLGLLPTGLVLFQWLFYLAIYIHTYCTIYVSPTTCLWAYIHGNMQKALVWQSWEDAI